MLAELEIINFALVEELRLELTPGLNVLTGETGAGKSIVVDALGFLLGGSPRDRALRGGTEGGRVSGRFCGPGEGARRLLEEWGLADGDEVLLCREIHPSGRSSVRLNNRPATLGNLRELAGHLVEVHGQHGHGRLLRPSCHLDVLDRYAGLEREEYRRLYGRCWQAETELEELRQAEGQRLREIEWLEHEVREICAVDPRMGEEEELESEIQVLAAAEELLAGTGEAWERLSGEEGAGDQVARAARILTSLARRDRRLEALAGRVGEAGLLLTEVSRELVSYREGIQVDPARLDELQGRRESLRRLQRKYGESLEGLLARLNRARERLQALRAADRRGHELARQVQALRGRLRVAAEELRCRRREAGRRLEEEVAGELAAVGMGGCRFQVLLESLEEPGPEGADRVEFLLAPNPGEPARPLARIASGGELSRIMLALSSLLARYEGVPTLVFDEIDAGLGGRAAGAVARKLRRLAEGHQVLCVTHLAVLAAAAHTHHYLYKEISRGRTRTRAVRLEGSAREAEVARMLSGDAQPERAREHARGLLGG